MWVFTLIWPGWEPFRGSQCCGHVSLCTYVRCKSHKSQTTLSVGDLCKGLGRNPVPLHPLMVPPREETDPGAFRSFQVVKNKTSRKSLEAGFIKVFSLEGWKLKRQERNTHTHIWSSQHEASIKSSRLKMCSSQLSFHVSDSFIFSLREEPHTIVSEEQNKSTALKTTKN